MSAPRDINEFIKPIKDKIDKAKLFAEIYGRPKSIHSIWNKMKKKGVDFEEVYDLFAIRIILDSPTEKEKEDCWKVYSMITDEYTPSTRAVARLAEQSQRAMAMKHCTQP